MESPNTPPPPPFAPPPRVESSPTPRQKVRGTFYNLQMVIGVAFILATLFTAWRPSAFPAEIPLQGIIAKRSERATPTRPGDPTATLRARPLIGIVVGHWGTKAEDPGSVCSDGFKELTVTQSVATKVKEFLTSSGLDVDLLEEFDNRLEGYKASALVSIHADSCDYINDQATGFKVAANMADPQREQAAQLTACLRSRYGRITGLPLHSTSITINMTNYHAFGVIDPTTPAAIIEVGFLNLDRGLLEKHPEIPARGLADGILCYMNNESITLPTPTAQSTSTP